LLTSDSGSCIWTIESHNYDMEFPGIVQNGVVVLQGATALPEGTHVSVVCSSHSISQPLQSKKKRIDLPLVRCDRPSSVDLTGDQIASILNAEDAASRY
jgi:hypothetical protein